ncbi:MAG: hypothetical protein N3A38_06145 [Planctomycetota bacterium]|nr:hypothetical protein [Planctomycetota bacterium]
MGRREVMPPDHTGGRSARPRRAPGEPEDAAPRDLMQTRLHPAAHPLEAVAEVRNPAGIFPERRRERISIAAAGRAVLTIRSLAASIVICLPLICLPLAGSVAIAGEMPADVPSGRNGAAGAANDADGKTAGKAGRESKGEAEREAGGEAAGREEGRAPAGEGAEGRENAANGQDDGAGIAAFKEERGHREYRPLRGVVWEFLDLGILIALLGGGVAMAVRNVPSRWILLQAAVSLAYLGFCRGGCICPVGAVADTAIGMVSPELIGPVTAGFFLAPLAAAAALRIALE